MKKIIVIIIFLFSIVGCSPTAREILKKAGIKKSENFSSLNGSTYYGHGNFQYLKSPMMYYLFGYNEKQNIENKWLPKIFNFYRNEFHKRDKIKALDKKVATMGRFKYISTAYQKRSFDTGDNVRLGKYDFKNKQFPIKTLQYPYSSYVCNDEGFFEKLDDYELKSTKPIAYFKINPKQARKVDRRNIFIVYKIEPKVNYITINKMLEYNTRTSKTTKCENVLFKQRFITPVYVFYTIKGSFHLSKLE